MVNIYTGCFLYHLEFCIILVVSKALQGLPLSAIEDGYSFKWIFYGSKEKKAPRRLGGALAGGLVLYG